MNGEETCGAVTVTAPDPGKRYPRGRNFGHKGNWFSNNRYKRHSHADNVNQEYPEYLKSLLKSCVFEH